MEAAEMTGGQGLDAVIEAVGMEAHGADTLAQKVSSAVMAATGSMERPFAHHVLFRKM